MTHHNTDTNGAPDAHTSHPYPKTNPVHLSETSPAAKANHHVTKNIGGTPPGGTSGLSRRALENNASPALSARFGAPIHTGPDARAPSPSSSRAGTSPGSFALPADIAGDSARAPYMYASPDTPGQPLPSDKTAWDFLPDGWTIQDHPRGCRGHNKGARTIIAVPRGEQALDPSVAPSRVGGRRFVAFRPITQLDHARLGIITPEMRRVADREPHLTPEQVRDEIAAGRLIIPANRTHLTFALDPMAIGRASRTKVNANMGASPVSSGTAEELEKLRWAEQWGADTVMDLSTGGNLDECRDAIIRASTVPIGTVPIYSMIIGHKLEDLTPDKMRRVILDTVEHQARQGVDYMTIHAGVRRAHLKLVKNRLIGIVSRGGSLLAKWMLIHNEENPMYTHWDEICAILHAHDVSFSIGDGLRPGGLADATDEAQLAELETIAELTERAWAHSGGGVQVMVEGPGHVPLDQIEFNMKLQRRLCHGAPFYVLGPLVTDVFPGYDHITSCIGATNAAYHGAAMLCYVTPKEHLGLPKKDDVKQGCIAYKIAAHAADVALAIPGTRDWDDDLTRARAALNWKTHFDLAYDTDTARALHDEDLDVDTDFCAMCGHDWCSVRISKEIQDFASGKDDAFQRMGEGGKLNSPIKSDALTEEQKTILQQRGVLSPEEVHRLASKTRKAMTPSGATDAESERSQRREGSDSPKPSCHSDYTDDAEAHRLQEQKLVQLNTAPAHNVPSEDRLI